MKGLFIQKYGDNSVLEFSDKLEVPKIKSKDEIFVKIYAASLNPIDYKMRDGLTQIILPYKFPLTLGHDFSGVVEDVGEDVKKFKKGDEVYGRAPDGRIGTIAEYITVPEYALALKPNNITHEEAASIPLIGLTVVQSFEDVKLNKGDTILITGGAGGTGTFAIQYATNILGTKVITTCSEKKSEICKKLGAVQTIDYKKEDFQKVTKDLDFAFDTTGEAEKMFCRVKKNGMVRSIATIPDSSVVDAQAKNGFNMPFYASPVLTLASGKTRLYAWYQGVDYKYIFMKPDGNELSKIAKYIEDGAIKPIIDKCFEFKDAKDAFSYIETGRATGKVVISIVKNEK